VPQGHTHMCKHKDARASLQHVAQQCVRAYQLSAMRLCAMDAAIRSSNSRKGLPAPRRECVPIIKASTNGCVTPHVSDKKTRVWSVQHRLGIHACLFVHSHVCMIPFIYSSDIHKTLCGDSIFHGSNTRHTAFDAKTHA
jgi:hypothetical protein